jgi:hypothetical protein
MASDIKDFQRTDLLNLLHLVFSLENTAAIGQPAGALRIYT